MLRLYLESLGPYALLAAGLFACLFVFVSLKKELRHLKLRLEGKAAGEETELRELQLKVEDLGARLRDAEQNAGMLVAPQAASSGLNISKRSQVIRMSRRGERPESIAASLSLPRGEVELLLKVYNLALSSPNDATS